MAETGTLHDAFLDELRDTYDAEKQLTKALPKLAKAAQLARSARGLRDAPRGDAGPDRASRAGLQEPRREGPRQALRRHRGHHRRRQVNHGGRLRRGDDGRVPDCRGPASRTLRDGCLRHAGGVGAGDGPHEAAELLQETLDEEKAADEKLSTSRRAASIRKPADGSQEDEEPVAGLPQARRNRPQSQVRTTTAAGTWCRSASCRN